LVLVVIAAAIATLIAFMEQTTAQRPDVPLSTLSGEVVTLDQLAHGKPMVVNLWATWCPPCIREMPLLEQAQKNHPGVVFVFVNQGEHPETAADFLQSSGLELNSVVMDAGRQVAKVTASTGLPTTLFYSAAGEQLDLHRGELKPTQLNGLLQRLQP
jgi:thiol-disulfide isomerase/thioredoxin